MDMASPDMLSTTHKCTHHRSCSKRSFMLRGPMMRQSDLTLVMAIVSPLPPAAPSTHLQVAQEMTCDLLLRTLWIGRKGPGRHSSTSGDLCKQWSHGKRILNCWHEIGRSYHCSYAGQPGWTWLTSLLPLQCLQQHVCWHVEHPKKWRGNHHVAVSPVGRTCRTSTKFH